MSLDISREIRVAQVEHDVETGKAPKKLYLGRVQWEALQAFAWESANFRMVDSAMGLARSEYCGMKVYKVDDENYVAVGV